MAQKQIKIIRVNEPRKRYAIAASLEPLLVPISKLKLDPENARTYPERNLDGIRSSLEHYGQTKPIVLAADGKTVLAGNGLVLAAQDAFSTNEAKKGWTHIAAVTTPLSGDEARAYAIADNKHALTSEWDFAVLSEQLFKLQNEGLIDLTGFVDFEIEPLLAGDWEPIEASEDEEEESAGPGNGTSRVDSISLTADARHALERAKIHVWKNVVNEENGEPSDAFVIEHVCKRYAEIHEKEKPDGKSD